MPMPGEETREETELEHLVCALAEKTETDGETGAEESTDSGD